MFYVLYSPNTNLYLNNDYLLTDFAKAERHGKPVDFLLHAARELWPDARWVGPCQDGEVP